MTKTVFMLLYFHYIYQYFAKYIVRNSWKGLNFFRSEHNCISQKKYSFSEEQILKANYIKQILVIDSKCALYRVVMSLLYAIFP